MNRFFIVCGLSLLLSNSCSIKESASECPSLLQLDLSDTRNSLRSKYLQSVIVDRSGRKDLIVPFAGNKPRISVKKGEVKIYAFYGLKSADYDKGTNIIHIAKNHEADSIYSHFSRKFCYKEREEELINLHKQWCSLKIVLNPSPDLQDVSFEIIGQWSGLDMEHNTAVRGDFICKARGSDKDVFEANIPRQGDNSLMLNMKYTDKGGLRKLRSIKLGEQIADRGYSWGKEDLDDLILQVDKHNMGINIDIVAWENGVNSPNIIL